MVKARVVFLGTPEFAAASLYRLLGAPDIDVVGVVTQPDRPAGRGRRLAPPPVKKLALASGLPLLQPERIRGNPEAVRFLETTRPDLLAVAAFGQLLPAPFFDWPSHGALNVHASLLPKFRGASPIVQAILQGERETGVTIMKIDKGLDTGGMLSKRAAPIGPDVTAGELEAALAALGAELLVETIGPYLRGEIEPRPQNEAEASHAPLIRKEQGRLDWSGSAFDVHNQIRAFNPWPVAFSSLRGELVKLWRSALPALGGTGRPPGEVLGLTAGTLLVQCGGGTVVGLRQLQPASRKRMSAIDFVNGFGVSSGEAFC